MILTHNAKVCSATATLTALLQWMGRKTQASRATYLKSVEITQHVWMTANDRVEGRDAASSRRVPSHDGLCGKTYGVKT